MTKVEYQNDGTVATVTMDDDKTNALSPALLTALNVAFDRAEFEASAVVLAEAFLSQGLPWRSCHRR
jgi:enoyl-CoA hydratase/carnithine racemase